MEISNGKEGEDRQHIFPHYPTSIPARIIEYGSCRSVYNEIIKESNYSTHHLLGPVGLSKTKGWDHGYSFAGSDKTKIHVHKPKL